MNKKNGFTLVELLAIIAILAIVITISVPSVKTLINSTRMRTHINNENKFIEAAKLYLSLNSSLIPENIGDTAEVKLSDIQTSKHIGTIKSPMDKDKNCNGYILITKIANKKYDYTPHLNCVENIGNSVEDGLIGHWKLDGNGIDSSISNFHCDLMGNPSLSVGVVGKSYYFNNSSDYLRCGHISGNTDLTGDVTISFWTKMFTLPVSRAGVLETSYGAEMAINVATNGSLQWYQGESGINSTPYESMSSNGQVFQIDKWVNIVLIRELQTKKRKIYVNGELNRETPYAMNVAVASSSYPLKLGRNYTGTLNGQLDDVRIYNRVLSADEIKYNYDITKTETR
ncbi:MAG: LamG domain-containing protein [Bacilli bacterium]|nr:LamG domain-containing protein [Bacilli bacterium]MDD4298266.1 LamG domain-containing protein [Bacilli bacterium]